MKEKKFRELVLNLEKTGKSPNKAEIQNVRKKLVKLLNSGTVTIPYKLDFSEDVIRKILFDKKNSIGDSERYTLLKEFNDIKTKLDFSNVSFDNVFLVGNILDITDISGAFGIRINPQTIWNKSLKFVNFDGVEFVGEGDFFKDVDLEGTRITNCKGARINPQTIRLKSLEGAFLEGVEFVGEGDIFEDVSLFGTTIYDCKGARINPRTIKDKSLYASFLKGVEFIDRNYFSKNINMLSDIDKFKGVCLFAARISNCKGARINPQTIRLKSLEGAFLEGVEFVGEGDIFEGVQLFSANSYMNGATITNCKGAKINPQTICGKNLEWVVLDGVEFVGEGDIFKDVYLPCTQILNCKGARINPQTIRNTFWSFSKFDGVEFVGIGDIFKYICLCGIEISNCKGARINPQTIYRKNLSNSKLDGISFVGVGDVFKDVTLVGTRIKNCKGAIINPQTIKNKSLEGGVLEGVELRSSFEGVDIKDAIFINCNEKPSIFVNHDMFKKFFKRNKDEQKVLVKKDK